MEIKKQNVVKIITHNKKYENLEGSAVIIDQPDGEDYLYVITAEHCIYGHGNTQIKEADIEKIECVYKYEESLPFSKPIKAIEWVADKKHDIAIIKFPKKELIDVIRSNEICKILVLDDCYKNQPLNCYSFVGDSLSIVKKISGICDDKEETTSKFVFNADKITLSNLTGNSSASDTKGISGSGVFVKNTNYLVGIIIENPNTLGANELRGVRLKKINEIIEKKANWKKIKINPASIQYYKPCEEFLENIILYEGNLKLHPENTKQKGMCIIPNIFDSEEIDNFSKAVAKNLFNYLYTERIKNEKYSNLNPDASFELYFNSRNEFIETYEKRNRRISELLLYTTLNTLFKAQPLLRISNLENEQSNAIHILQNGATKPFLLFSEVSLTNKKLKDTLFCALNNLVNSIKNINRPNLFEHGEYVYEEFEEYIEQFKQKKYDNFELRYICFVTYEKPLKFESEDKTENKKELVKQIIEDTEKILEQEYPLLESHIKNRISYLLFPISSVEKLIEAFSKSI